MTTPNCDLNPVRQTHALRFDCRPLGIKHIGTVGGRHDLHEAPRMPQYVENRAYGSRMDGGLRFLDYDQRRSRTLKDRCQHPQHAERAV